MDNDSGDDGTDELRQYSVEKSEKKNDQDWVEGMRQEVYSKGNEMHNENSNIYSGRATCIRIPDTYMSTDTCRRIQVARPGYM